ncbi:MAG TPA: tRNA preQ1(34) S-adenosylmethionine ribosyltransferase-isomerase QueA [Candidatus Omnitrophota bacterium]|nr:tRNA preQ1(34) S-adenosylmethionine ribosyltransferase-isomerase QueA [Candidatus Omnitrophota bacterium]
MKLSNFDYELPKDLIAQYPLKERHKAKLLVVNRANGSIEHRLFEDILSYLNKDDLLILNNTKVLACRLMGRKATGGKVEVLLTRRKTGSIFECLIQPSRTKTGEKIIFAGGEITGIISGRGEISFRLEDANAIYKFGQVPLPPYIKREPEDLDKVYYQTVYAEKEGAIASPTAGLHFTEELLKEIASRGIDAAYITLHVGLGTFKPVKSDNITEHKMEPEYFNVPKNTQEKIENARLDKKRIVAVGTTSLRALESYANGVKEGNTDLFIYPGYKFKLVGSLLTNFHLPKTTLFMLVCAFGGENLMKKAYQEAVAQKYRFYSYGDAMLII